MNQVSKKEIFEACNIVIDKLPSFWKEFRKPQIPRVVEEISWIYVDGGKVIDLGGSSGFHCSVCAVLGMKPICVDNFKVRESGNISDCFYDHDLEAEEVAKSLGVEFIHTNLLTWTPPFPVNSIDVIMTYDNIEHLHHSPRKTYSKLVSTLKNGGLLLIGAPNAANLFKRLRVISGKNIFSQFDEWYMYPNFIGHVREPVVDDYYKIAKDLNLTVASIKGRNWLGLRQLKNNNILLDNFLSLGDFCLKQYPQLCSDIYLLAYKE